MIKVIEKDFLDDNFINKSLIKNISLHDKIFFSKENIYYFGNYKPDKLPLIKERLLKNKKRLINAIERNIRFIICGNSLEMFNNTFKKNNLNIYTAYCPYMFKRRLKKLTIKKQKNDMNLRTVDSLNKGIEGSNFKYKNFVCISDENLIDKIIKKTKQTTLSY